MTRKTKTTASREPDASAEQPTAIRARTGCPSTVALEGLEWGAELTGGQAAPRRARALGELVQAALLVDSTSDADLEHFLGTNKVAYRYESLDDVRRIVQVAREFSVLLDLALGGSGAARRQLFEAARAIRSLPPRKRPDDIAGRRRKLLALIRDYDPARVVTRAIRALDHDGRELPPMTAFQAFAVEVSMLDQRLLGHSDAMADALAYARKASTPPLMAAKFSVRMDMFDDRSRGKTVQEAERAARRHYDSALKRPTSV